MHESKETQTEVKAMIEKISNVHKDIASKVDYWDKAVNDMKDILKHISQPISTKYKTFPDHNSGIVLDDRTNPHIWLKSDGKLLEVYIDKENQVTKTNQITITQAIEDYEHYDFSHWLASRKNALKDGLEASEKKLNALSGIPSNLRPVNT